MSEVAERVAAAFRISSQVLNSLHKQLLCAAVWKLCRLRGMQNGNIKDGVVNKKGVSRPAAFDREMGYNWGKYFPSRGPRVAHCRI